MSFSGANTARDARRGVKDGQEKKKTHVKEEKMRKENILIRRIETDEKSSQKFEQRARYGLPGRAHCNSLTRTWSVLADPVKKKCYYLFSFSLFLSLVISFTSSFGSPSVPS